MFSASVIIVCVLVTSQVYALENGLARTPPMGWMTWQRFRCTTDCNIFPNDCISENLIKRTVDALVRDGYRDAGYEYVIIDDCWPEMERSSEGLLVPDKNRFPSGMKALSDYIHARGLKFGIYQDYGTKTCAGYPGIIGYQELDAILFASWGVDYVKLDGCYSEPESMDEGYVSFGQLLNKTGRPMVYSCSWPVYQEEKGIEPNFTLISEHCNLWRNWDDINDSWSSLASIADYFAKNQERIQRFAGPGHWNDPDMLLIGNFGLSLEQSKVQMSLWAILAAPLLMSNDLDTIRPEFKDILLNREILSINQDPLGIQGTRVKVIDNIEIWTRPILPRTDSSHSFAVAYVSLRTDGAPHRIQLNLVDIGLTNLGGYVEMDVFEDTVSPTVKYPETLSSVIVNPTSCVLHKFVAL
ncbi:alpha-N-acetylgalactosaminidase-like [Bradysia coprophila]|uniref:alpha-N-acetylgalactosaminidase-like n=1 Tax=Bradysia coprophila TaxID=38358 RepID=UPI00187DB633|nr:alpha-N-acetylgalactosaminidase-like [Bradysia coprophila]